MTTAARSPRYQVSSRRGAAPSASRGRTRQGWSNLCPGCGVSLAGRQRRPGSRGPLAAYCSWCRPPAFVQVVTECLVCGAPIFPQRGPGRPRSQDVCSKQCANRSRAIVRRFARAEMVECQWCFREFLGAASRKFCSEWCRRRFSNHGSATALLWESCTCCAAPCLGNFRRNGPPQCKRCRRNQQRQTDRLSGYRRRGAKGRFSDRDWCRLVARHGGQCAYCHIAPATTRDHVIPVSRGGTSWIGNILPACESCNSSKHNKLLIEWRHG
jgi:hypothetical protein